MKPSSMNFLEKKRSVLIIFEGWDAAGKGGDIRRLVEELNPRLYRVVPVGSPNDTEKAHQYLWRFCDAALWQDT
ncbi:hypothetical protein [Methanosarcina horonobensis]|uniref:hypothetical protein n=1 Tax=Methanosarcina horonobensis TaxID=418008 RepID=UPI0022B8F175|nr:hypothetical protein [Methanosarcina horonobensis]